MSPSSVTPATVTRRTRVFPLSKGEGTHSKALSIVDGSVLRYSPTGATWFFEGPSLLGGDTQSLLLSLRKTLDIYPQWTGSLHMPLHNVAFHSVPHTQRFNRPQLTWGTDNDPGVEFIEASSSYSLSLMPSAIERASSHQQWDASFISNLGTLSAEPKLALHDQKQSQGLPCLVIQTTRFACGGMAIALKLAHPCADAQTLLTFVHDWAKIHRGSQGLDTEREFAPQLLDQVAGGNIDGPTPNPEIMARSQMIPLHRFDWWASATPDCPPFMLPSTEIPHSVTLADVPIELGRPLPWKTWDILTPALECFVHFTQAEIITMWEAAVVAANKIGVSGPPKISKLDALLAHI